MRAFAPGSAFVACCLLWACHLSPAPAPEMVVRQWQFYIDHNQFDSARLYSTELARSYVDFLDALAQGDTSETDNTQLYNLQCDIQGDSAICHYLIEGEMGEKIPDTLILQRINGRWLVHRVEGFLVIPVDSLQPGDEDLIFPSDSLDEELE
ncbi:MAG: hypothetical protein IT260_13395 [Saprospiraceae bacterium]|nr:hypothetical protein [Saprospiraceae bacterium]